jgi:hypothetical protein
MKAKEVIPQCMQCSSFVGTMKDNAFQCKSCGALTDQPEAVTGPKVEVEKMPEPVPGDSILHTDELRVLLEAYDRGITPFHKKSEAYDLQPLVEDVFETSVNEAVSASLNLETEKVQKGADEYYAERRQALIEAVTDACAPHLQGLGADIVALIEEYIPDD